MPPKTFTTRRYWHNTLLVVWVAPFLVLIGILLLAVNGTFAGLIIAGAFIAFGSLIALTRDIGGRSQYTFVTDHLILEAGRSRREIPLQDLIDASLVDRRAARDYIRQRVATMDLKHGGARRAAIQELVRYCSVDIGLNTLTFGVGRRVTDLLPMARYDLVLLRTRTGEDLLLSPRYNQDFVETVSRLISSRPLS